MNDAAVGFHCPSCVAEGRKTQRTARTSFGGMRPSSGNTVTMTLIGINAVIWVLIVATGGNGSKLLEWLALTPRGQCSAGGGGYYPQITNATACGFGPGTHWVAGVATGAPWQLLTSTFAHVEVLHIGFNMLALWFIGPQLEQAMGRARYLAVYVLSGLAGSAMVYWFSAPAAPTLGASGSIFGLLGALLVLAIKMRADLQQLLMWIGLNFAFTFFGGAQISWQGHVGGFVGGAALAAILAYAPRARRTTWQVAGMSAVGVLIAVAILARTVVLT
jgi:membrane associated rhomboid family serine protease